MTTRATHAAIVDSKEEQRTGALYDVVIIGGGIAGLTTALSLPPGFSVLLITKGALGESNTRYAQGGLAAAVGRDDTPALHLSDTLAAGAGLVDEEAARILVTEAPGAVAWLIGQGTQFDRRGGTVANGASGALADQYILGREAAHSRWRILHAHGDATGAEIERALVDAMRHRPNSRILERAQVLDLLVEDGRCVGVSLMSADGLSVRRATRGVVLANGGAGRLWARTSNPDGATADGLALAWRAGALLADLEFVQFHPTVLVPPNTSAEPFLISEAVRGEGAYLRNAAGERFMPRYHADAELAPRDVVARAIAEELAHGPVYLDVRHLPAKTIVERFPTISAVCQENGLNLTGDLIPVAPAAHYFMGGVVVDTEGRTTVPGLYAVGEVSCTGVHGANRLASNSLLEGLVYGRRVAGVLISGHAVVWPRAPRLPGYAVSCEPVLPQRSVGIPADVSARRRVQQIMWEYAGLRRSRTGLETAQAQLERLAQSGPFDPETCSMLVASQLIVCAALAREESRGGHSREDFSRRDPALDGRHTLVAQPASGSGMPEEETAHVAR